MIFPGGLGVVNFQTQIRSVKIHGVAVSGFEGSF